MTLSLIFSDHNSKINLSTELKPLSTETSDTPAYPAGHAYQALLLASHLSKKYPEKKKWMLEGMIE